MLIDYEKELNKKALHSIGYHTVLSTVNALHVTCQGVGGLISPESFGILMACSVALFVYMFCYDNMPSGELAEKIGITAANMSILKTGKAKVILKKISFLRGMGFE